MFTGWGFGVQGLGDSGLGGGGLLLRAWEFKFVKGLGLRSLGYLPFGNPKHQSLRFEVNLGRSRQAIKWLRIWGPSECRLVCAWLLTFSGAFRGILAE